MIDFEIATKKAYEQSFPGIIVKGCLFHFGQSLFKNFVKHGFKTAYLENEELQRWFKRLFCLVLTPIPTLDDQITLLQIQLLDLQDKYPRSISTEGRCHRFWNYFINTYVEDYFPKIMWNHFETVEVRTNNNNNNSCL